MERDPKTECWNCTHRRQLVSSAHILCGKPDPKMRGNTYGIRNGWFYYPISFQPIWKEKLCDNFEPDGSMASQGTDRS